VACYGFCPSTARRVAHEECAPPSVGVYMCVASLASHSTVHEMPSGIEPASVELVGLLHATVSCPSTSRGVAQADCGL